MQWHCPIPVWKSLFHRNTVPARDLLLGRGWECSSVSHREQCLQQFICILHRGTLDHFSTFQTWHLHICTPLPPSIIWYITISSLSPNRTGWPQMISVVGIQCKCFWAASGSALTGYRAIPCCFVITLHCLEEPCSRWTPGAPVLERGPVRRQHLLTDQIKHRLNLQIKSCRTNLFQTCFYSSKVNWHKGTVHFDYRILLRVWKKKESRKYTDNEQTLEVLLPIFLPLPQVSKSFQRRDIFKSCWSSALCGEEK